MRVATFNILNGAVPGVAHVDPRLLADAVVTLGADLLALQEVDRGQPRSGRADLTAVAAEAMGASAYRFAAAMTGTPEGPWTAATGEEQPEAPAYGVALLSRLPVTGWRVVRLPPAPIPVPYRFHGSRRPRLVTDEARVAVVAEVATPGGPLRVVATHLSFLGVWNGVQLRRLVREAVPPAGPTLLLGDLNMRPRRAVRISGLRSLAPALTFPATDPSIQIDHLLAQGTVRASRARAVRLPMSDHCALVAEVTVGRETRETS